MEMERKPTVAELRARPHFSHSALSLYQSCSLAFFYRYVKKLQAEKTSKCLLFGSAYHKTLDRLAAMRLENRSFTIPEAKAVFAGEWQCQLASAVNVDFESSEEPEALLRQGLQMLETYLPSWQGITIISHAEAFSIDIADESGCSMSKQVIGEYDLIIEKDDKPVIVDFKTASKRWSESKPDKDLQATLYCFSYHKNYGIIPAFRFDVVTKAKTPAVQQLETSRCEDDFKRMSKLYLSIDKAILAGSFIPNESSFFCGSCEYAKACSEWHRK